MNIPKTVKIGGEIYKVKTVKCCTRYEEDDDEKIDGICIYENNIIEISEHCEGTFKDMIFLHELIHAMYEHAGLDYSNEEHIDRLTRTLHAVITDNPKIFERNIKYK